MKYTTPLFTILMLTVSSAPAQEIFYQKQYHLREEYCLGLEVLPNDDRLLAGYTVENTGLRAGLIMRSDETGAPRWTKTYMVAGNECIILDIRQKNNGNFLALFRINASQNRGGWMELDANGNVLWADRTSAESMLENILPLPDGYLLSGQFNPSNGLFDTGLLLKIEEDGDVAWALTIDAPAGMLVR